MPPPKKTGRPRATVDLALVEKLAGIACTLEEIAAVTGVSKSTLIRLQKQQSFNELIERGRGKGRVSLRRLQWQSAEGIFETIEDPAGKRKPRRSMIVPPNVTAQIWLGKQMLGQRSFEKEEKSSDGTIVPPLIIEVYSDPADQSAEPGIPESGQVPRSGGGA